MQLRLYLTGIAILVAGLLGAALVYVISADDGGDAVGYEVVGGKVYAISPEDSKRYVRDMELYGGKAAVLADEVARWLSSLFRGRRLAYTLASVAAASAFACFLAAHLLRDARSEDRDG